MRLMRCDTEEVAVMTSLQSNCCHNNYCNLDSNYNRGRPVIVVACPPLRRTVKTDAQSYALRFELYRDLAIRQEPGPIPRSG